MKYPRLIPAAFEAGEPDIMIERYSSDFGICRPV